MRACDYPTKQRPIVHLPTKWDLTLKSAMQILDSPRFDWRGVLLDVGRHFFPVPFIYKFLDVCAFYKVNKFHWHLTEDQVRYLEISFVSPSAVHRACERNVLVSLTTLRLNTPAGVAN